MTDQPDALLPCPFCGVQMRVGVHTAFHPENQCVFADRHRAEIDEDEYEAWNRRPTPPSALELARKMTAADSPKWTSSDWVRNAVIVARALLASRPQQRDIDHLEAIWRGEA